MLTYTLTILVICIASAIAVMVISKRAPVIESCDCETISGNRQCKMEAEGRPCVRGADIESSETEPLASHQNQSR
ncbi:hypothetical protein Pla22_23410 [Rubripirellula amarantea]|uniref:Uncharacterized protein n=1 Tax=Rubripirellula amarantea TaxID=2527999 RepID=A0A5C5WX63_9BACT|nr:hypothetical protein Pla22_23410 [Rubripirellula amarantea]